MRFIQLHAERQGEGPPALRFPVVLQPCDTGVVADGGKSIRRLVAGLAGIDAPLPMHPPETFGLGIVGRPCSNNEIGHAGETPPAWTVSSKSRPRKAHQGGYAAIRN